MTWCCSGNRSADFHLLWDCRCGRLGRRAAQVCHFELSVNMEDFEYSVEICDRDWQCFFAECEECNLLPPSLAGLDDSGMSDFDEGRSLLARSPQKMERMAGFSDADHSVACSPECSTSPVDHYLNKYGVSGMESILSGSEEDLHLQTVNMFFERMKNYTEADRVHKPRQEELHGIGEASRSILPKSKPKLSSPPANKESTETHCIISSISKARKLQLDPICHEAACNVVLQTSGLPKLLITEEDWSDISEHEATPQGHTPHSLRTGVTPDSKKSEKADMCSSKIGDLSWQTNADALENPSSSYSGTSSPNKSLSQESSPSASVKRKRRKKRRLSIEPAEGGHSCGRPSDSEEDQCARRAGRAPPGDTYWSYLGETQKKFAPTCSLNTLKVMTLETPLSAGRKCAASELTESATTSDRLHSQTADRRISASNYSPPNSHSCKPQIDKYINCLGSVSASVAGEPQITKHQSETNHSTVERENEQKVENSGTEEVKSMTCSLSLNMDFEALAVCQSDKQSTAGTVLAEDTAPSGRDKHTLCNGEAEPELQLETTCHDRDQHGPVLKDGGKSPLHISEPFQSAETSLNEVQEPCTQSAADCVNSVAEENSACTVSVRDPTQEVPHPLVSEALSEKAEPALEVLPDRNPPCGPADKSITGSRDEGAASHTPNSEITPPSSCSALDPTPVNSLPKENVPDVLSCRSANTQNGSVVLQERASSLSCVTQKEGETKGRSCDTAEPHCGAVDGAEVTAASEAKEVPDLKPSVFAMSSFWSEMEKLTINDILGLRMTDKSALPPSSPTGSLTPLQEAAEPEDSVFLSQRDECMQKCGGMSGEAATNAPMGVLWDSEPSTDLYPRIALTSVGDLSQPVHHAKAQNHLRKISKNVSMHNLRALETQSHNYTWKGQPLPSLDGGGLKSIEYFSNGHASKQDKDADCFGPATADGYRISLTDIFHYIFGGKQSSPSPPTADDTAFTIDGCSVSETYDHFFSEFDTESFFFPLIKANDETETVPIFSCSRSTTVQFPEVYDQLFPSSSDTSSDEEDEERGRPLRVVTRFNRQGSSPQICTDIYDNFFSDSEVRQNFFWKTTLSLRNVLFSGSAVEKQRSEPTTLRNMGRPLPRILTPLNVLGNQDAVFPDPLLFHLEDRISRQLSKPSLRYEEFQMAVPNPRLDAPLLPFKQSDMCLVCIAFASWVLKTANPQVGDTWKAVLLANVSALSAIRYLRKHAKAEAAGGQKKLQLAAAPSS